MPDSYDDLLDRCQTYCLPYDHDAVDRMERVARDDSGKIKGIAPTLYNASVLLSAWGVSLRLNQMRSGSSAVEVRGLEKYELGGVLSDASERWLLHEFTQYEFARLGLMGAMRENIQLLAQRHRYHPVKDYLATLAWDREARLDTWLIRHAGAEDTSYTRAVSALPLIAAVRRIDQPGAKFDELLVLQSPQGWVKSTALRSLCKDPDWFSDSMPLGSSTKEVIEYTEGKWILEISELQTRSEAKHSQIKAFLSRQVDKGRLAYERHAVEVPRQFVAIGTLNDTTFLSDPTGDRRYWPVAIGKPFDIAALEGERDQIWAEAAHRARAGESIRLDKSLWSVATEVQKRFATTTLEDELRHKLGEHSGKLTNRDLWELLGVSLEKRKGNQQLKPAMEELGWKPCLIGRSREHGWKNVAGDGSHLRVVRGPDGTCRIAGPAPHNADGANFDAGDYSAGFAGGTKIAGQA